MENIFVIIGVALLIATVVGMITKLLKQPLIIAYILTGIFFGPLVLGWIQPSQTLTLFSQIGVAFLLFIVGLHLNMDVLRKVGFISTITGVGQVIFTSFIGFFIAKSLGFSSLSSVYIAVALTFSSTIIIVKLLTDKNDLDTLYGKISVGFLIVQDIIAIFALVFITSLSQDGSLGNLAFISLIKVLGLFLIVYLLSRYVLSYVFKVVSRSQELLFITSISWCFLAAILAFVMGFSIEIGALLAGIALSSLPYAYEISGKIRPLRDFFLVIFFINLGLHMVVGNFDKLLIPGLIFSLFVLVGNPIIVLILMGWFGYSKRTGFLAGLTVAQISEFSLILVSYGLLAGHIGTSVVSLVTFVGIITITLSTYMIMYGDKLYNLFSPYLNIFERKITKEPKGSFKHKRYDVILFGAHRIGHYLIKKLKSSKKRFLVIDFNPRTIDNLRKQKVDCLYGDVSDEDILEMANNFRPKMVISTIPGYEDNMVLVSIFKNLRNKPIIFVTAKNVEDIVELYKSGADFVISPEILSGHKIADYVTSFDKKKIKSIGKQHHVSLIKEIETGWL